MRRQVALLMAAFVAACASASPPPGGPEDKAPPRVVRVTPDTNALNVHPGNASFYFDEVINDRGTGEQEVDRFFLVSPSDGAPNVSWHRSRIDVRPRHGFQPNVAYTITLLPGLSDLHGNRMKTGTSLVFATGPTIPPHHITGIVFDWVADRVAPRAYVEAIIPGPDSVRYLAQSDTLGRFSLGPLPQGTYLVRAIIDQNNNRALDRSEAFDTIRVTAPNARPLEMLAIVRDTLPARILSIAEVDSLTLAVTFDHPIDAAVVHTPSQFRLVGPDSTPVPIRSAYSPAEQRIADSVSRKMTADSLRRLDTAAARVVTPPPAPTTPTSVVPALAPPPPPPKPSRPAPFTLVTLKLGRPLARGTLYRLSVTEVHALSGKVASSDRTFTTAKPAPVKPPADTGAARRPPAAAPPPARPPRT